MAAIGKKMLMALVLIELIVLAGVIVYYSTLPPNTPPVADAGEAQTTLAGFPVRLDGSGSTDPDGDDLTYYWSMIWKPEGSLAELSAFNVVNPTFTPDKVGRYVITLIVSDGKSYSQLINVTVTAKSWFTDVAKHAGVAGHGITEKFFDLSSDPMAGAAWGDYDGDGDHDLYVANAEVVPRVPTSSHLYRNNGDGTFTDVGIEVGIAYEAMRGVRLGNATRSVLWGDFDNDGDLDLYLVNSGTRRTGWTEANVLYRNDGDGSFTDVTVEAGVGDTRFGMGAAWGDYDNDGYLDLAIANLVRINKTGTYNETIILYRNNGDGTFTDVAPQLNIGQGKIRPKNEWMNETVRSGSTWQSFWFDFDNDGDLDLLLTSDYGTNLLYRNNGDGTFTEVTKEAGLWESTGRGVDAGDYDNDGDLDLYITGIKKNHLWRNNGDGTFTEITVKAGVEGRGGVYWGCVFFDFDNDGDLDLYVAAGDWTIYKTMRERKTLGVNLLYRNNGDGTFTDVTEISGLGLTSVSRGLALADFDNDGDLDVFVTCSDDRNYLFRNDIANYLGNNWLKIRLNGTVSNRYGIGAMVKVTSGDLTSVEQLKAGGSFLSEDALELHFGLGKRSVVDRIEVRWPSGIIQVLTNVKPNQTITITETPTKD